MGHILQSGNVSAGASVTFGVSALLPRTPESHGVLCPETATGQVHAGGDLSESVPATTSHRISKRTWNRGPTETKLCCIPTKELLRPSHPDDTFTQELLYTTVLGRKCRHGMACALRFLLGDSLVCMCLRKTSIRKDTQGNDSNTYIWVQGL